MQFAPAVTSLTWPILLLLPGWDQPLGLQSCFPFPALASQISANIFMLWVVPPHPANTGPSLSLFCAVLGFVKLLQFAHLKIRISQVGRVDCQDCGMAGPGQVQNALTLGSEVSLRRVVHSLRSSYEPLIWPFSPITPFACIAWASEFKGLAKFYGNDTVCYFDITESKIWRFSFLLFLVTVNIALPVTPRAIQTCTDPALR